jgi:glycerol-3-phosphate acyltransferase PlsY
MSLTLKSVLVFLAYVIGSIPMGVILSSFIGGQDIRETGSGNIGATNVYRTHGKKLGIITLAADALKGLIPTLAAVLFGLSNFWISLIALAAFLGHLYPLFLQFKGGKGVATALGIFLIISPASLLISFLVFVLIIYAFRYVSLASLSATAMIPLLVGFINSSEDKVFIILSLIIASFIFVRHKENIKRLLNGEELKV